MRTAVRVLASRLWYRHALCVSGVSGVSDAVMRGEFIRKFECFASRNTGYGLDPRLVRDWETGKHAVSEGIVHRVENQVAGTQYVFAITTLLKPKRVSALAAGRAVQNFYVTRPDGNQLWILPPPGASEFAGGTPTSYFWNDSASLASRGDFFGLLAILTLLRESVADANLHRVERHAQNLYATLPSVSRLGWVRPDVDLLLQCIEGMMVGFPWFHLCVKIDWDAFRAQMLDPRPWQGVPSWVIPIADAVSRKDTRQLPLRPVPLLERMKPLGPYVDPPNKQREELRTKRQLGFSLLAPDLHLGIAPLHSREALEPKGAYQRPHTAAGNV